MSIALVIGVGVLLLVLFALALVGAAVTAARGLRRWLEWRRIARRQRQHRADLRRVLNRH